MGLRYAADVNWGDRTTLRGDAVKDLVSISVDHSQSMVVYAMATLRNANPDVACMVNVEWGHGGATVSGQYEIIHRLRLPLVGSMVRASCRLMRRHGSSSLEGVEADVSCVIAVGSDGENLPNTRWVRQSGHSGTLSSAPARLMAIEGFNAKSDTFLMLFDREPPRMGGDALIASVVRPVRAGKVFRILRSRSHGFHSGIHWLASSDPMTIQPDIGAMLRIEAELLL